MDDLEPRVIQVFRKLAGKSGRLSVQSLTESDAVLDRNVADFERTAKTFTIL